MVGDSGSGPRSRSGSSRSSSRSRSWSRSNSSSTTTSASNSNSSSLVTNIAGSINPSRTYCNFVEVLYGYEGGELSFTHARLEHRGSRKCFRLPKIHIILPNKQ